MAAPVHEEELISKSVETETVRWDRERGMIAASLEKRIGNLVLSTNSFSKIAAEKRIEILLEAFREEGFKLLNWGEEQMEWQARVMSVAVWRPDEGWPDVSEENLLQTADDWLAPYLSQVSKRADFQRLEMNSILQGILPWNLNTQLDRLAPPKLKVPSGSLIKLSYFKDGRSPIIEVRLQEMFGLTETPSINEGRTKIILQLLSPGYKPVQVTQDLKSFWQTTYHEVRKELRMRYPRHHWPEDPWTAEAMRGAKKRVS